MNNVVGVLGEQQRDSAIHIHVSILPQTPFPSRLPHNTEWSSIWYTVSFLTFCNRGSGSQNVSGL